MGVSNTADQDTVMDIESQERWEGITRSFRDHNLYQTWEYEATREDADRSEVRRTVVVRGSRPIGAAQVRIRRIPILGGGLAYIYRGPLWKSAGATPEDLGSVLAALQRTYVGEHNLTLRIAPNVNTHTDGTATAEIFPCLGFGAENHEQVDRTIFVDLARETDELRQGLAQKWRNCLNQAERKGLKVTQGSDAEAWGHFERLYTAMWAGKQFETGVSVRTFGLLQDRLSPDEKMRVLLAWYEGVPVAGHVSSQLGDTCIYLLGASGDAGRKVKAAYLLQWEVMVRAKQSGARWYDLGGIDPEANSGVYHFKSGLGGAEAEFLPRQSIAGPGARNRLVPLAEAAYRRLRSKAGTRG